MSHSTTIKAAVRGLALALALVPVVARANIIISEVCDPRLNYASDRFLEVYNTGDQAADLTGWRLVAVANNVDVFTWNLSGLIDAHQALVAGDATTVVAFPVAFADEAWSGANGNWNGKVGDGARLVDPSGTTVDLVVVAGTAFENADYVRNASVTAPSPVYVAAQWAATAVDLATQATPGTHNTGAPAHGPVVTAIVTDPTAPVAGDAVNVQATVTDAAAAVTQVAVNWGVGPTSLPNRIDMTLVAGNVYRTTTPVPAQAGGSTVYYRVEATNDIPAVTTSELKQYSLPWSLTIAEIQGMAATSPYDGATVRTQGVVTGVFGTTFTLQDGEGPWTGLWVRGAVTPAPGDLLTVNGRVTEADGAANTGNTMLVDAQVLQSLPGSPVPAPAVLTTAACNQEAWEGVLVHVDDADCTNMDAGGGEWVMNDGSGACRVGRLGQAYVPVLGSTYAVEGPLAFSSGAFKVEPRSAAGIVWTQDHAAPVVIAVVPLSETTLRVTFSESVEPVSAGSTANYTIPGLTVFSAARLPTNPARVVLTVSAMSAGNYNLAVTGVADLFGNAATGAAAAFSYLDPLAPPGYYDPAAGLSGQALQAALHDIIKGHTAKSYDFAWTAYQTADVRPDNGKVWDIYSDIPGGTPPYLYDFGVNEGGIGGAEGTGYTREHTWCKNWFGGTVSPMYTDLFTLFPCDTHMNGTRGVNPYGETNAPVFVSLNGSKLGPSAVPGYTGTVFEPRDDFKGDLARAYMYFSTRYYSEDAGWPGGPSTAGATLLPWVVDMYLQWVELDPVSQKEIDRNNAIYAIQGNRNPFVDHPEYVQMVFGGATSGVGDLPAQAFVTLRANPNPFNPRTAFTFNLSRPGSVRLAIYDIRGARVATLVDGAIPAGEQNVKWDGLDARGNAAPSGIYFARLETESVKRTVKVTLTR